MIFKNKLIEWWLESIVNLTKGKPMRMNRWMEGFGTFGWWWWISYAEQRHTPHREKLFPIMISLTFYSVIWKYCAWSIIIFMLNFVPTRPTETLFLVKIRNQFSFCNNRVRWITLLYLSGSDLNSYENYEMQSHHFSRKQLICFDMYFSDWP